MSETTDMKGRVVTSCIGASAVIGCPGTIVCGSALFESAFMFAARRG